MPFNLTDKNTWGENVSKMHWIEANNYISENEHSELVKNAALASTSSAACSMSVEKF
jgi:hypothetical protein